jgi:deoxyribonuclease-4
MSQKDLVRFGTVGAPQTTRSSGTPAAIEHTAQLGLHHLEIAWTRNVSASDQTCADIKAAAKANGISLSVHAPYFINLNSQTEEKMKASDERLLNAARKGFLAGAKDIVFHPASYHAQDPALVYERVAEQLTKLSAQLQAEDVEVTLRPETMGKSAMFGTLEEVVHLSRDVPNVLPCVDWAHLHARTGNGTFNTYDEFAAALALIRDTLGERGLHQSHNHISGITYTSKGEKSHIPLNESDLNYRDLLLAFVDFGVQGTVGIEAPEPFHTADCLIFQATYRRLVELSHGEDIPQEES